MSAPDVSNPPPAPKPAADSAPRLVVSSGRGAGRAVSLRPRVVLITAGPVCQALVARFAGRTYLRGVERDLTVELNGRAIREFELRVGDELRLGSRCYRFEDPNDHSTQQPAADASNPPSLWLRGENHNLQLTGPFAVIGSRAGCDLRLSDPRVGDLHALVFCEQGQWFVRDLASQIGTSLNGARIKQEKLGPGDLIQIAATTLRAFDAETEQRRSTSAPPVPPPPVKVVRDPPANVRISPANGDQEAGAATGAESASAANTGDSPPAPAPTRSGFVLKPTRTRRRRGTFAEPTPDRPKPAKPKPPEQAASPLPHHSDEPAAPPAKAQPTIKSRGFPTTFLSLILLFAMLISGGVWRTLRPAAHLQGLLTIDPAMQNGPADPKKLESAQNRIMLLLRHPETFNLALARFRTLEPDAAPGFLTSPISFSKGSKLDWEPSPLGGLTLLLSRTNDDGAPIAAADVKRMESLLAALAEAAQGRVLSAQDSARQTADQLQKELITQSLAELEAELVYLARREAELSQELRVMELTAPTRAKEAELLAALNDLRRQHRAAVEAVTGARIQSQVSVAAPPQPPADSPNSSDIPNDGAGTLDSAVQAREAAVAELAKRLEQQERLVRAAAIGMANVESKRQQLRTAQGRIQQLQLDKQKLMSEAGNKAAAPAVGSGAAPADVRIQPYPARIHFGQDTRRFWLASIWGLSLALIFLTVALGRSGRKENWA